MSWLGKYWRSSIGGKVTMAVTGVLLFLFLIGHLAGNLQVFGGQDPINSYAKWLKDHPLLLYLLSKIIPRAIVIICRNQSATVPHFMQFRHFLETD